MSISIIQMCRRTVLKSVCELSSIMLVNCLQKPCLEMVLLVIEALSCLPGLNQFLAADNCLAQGHNKVTPLSLKLVSL